VEIDDDARLHAFRFLVADADHLDAMRTAAQQLAVFARLQVRHDAANLAGPDVQHSQGTGAVRGIAVTAKPAHIFVSALRLGAFALAVSIACLAVSASGESRMTSLSENRMSTARISRASSPSSWSSATSRLMAWS